MSMVTDSIYWLWNNPVTREVVRYPKVVGDLFFTQKAPVVTQVVEKLPLNMIAIPSWTRVFVRLAGISGASAVAMGAYGAHVFYQRGTSEELKQVYETANRYHFMHTLALLGVPLCKRPKLVSTEACSSWLVY
ncbi:Protein of unknown function DUF423 [Trinorchestia longiramus]|nr:Protein of unknown function DUF423 [Trinorchestia longiramus]